MQIIDNIDRATLFLYVSIFIIILYVFSNIKIGLNIVFGIMIAGVFLWYLYYNDQKNKMDGNELDKQKLDSLIPKPEVDNNGSVIDFLFSIQDFYVYNPQSYINMVKSLDRFFELSNEAKDDNSLAGINFVIMKDEKRNALNSLMEISFKLYPMPQYDEKLRNAITDLSTILNGKIKEIYDVHKNYLYYHGLSIQTSVIDSHEIPAYNTYNDEFFTTQLI